MPVSWRISEGVVFVESDEQMARMAETLTDDRSVEFRVFTHPAEAEAWMRGPA